MRFWWSLVFCALVACGSKSGSGGEANAGSGSGSAAAPPAPRPLAVAFVVQGSEMWIGNDDIEQPDGDMMLGALKPFKAAFAHVSFKDLPAGSKATVISYGEHASVRRPMGPIETLTPAAFGDQKDAHDVIDRNLAEGVGLGIDELAKLKDVHRVLVIIGDGTDENADKAKEAFAKLASRAGQQEVDIVSLVLEGPISPPNKAIRSLDPAFVRVSSAEAIVEQLMYAFTRLVRPTVVPSGPPAPLVLAVVMSGSEIWVGNDDFTPKDDPGYYPGALHGVRAAFDRAPLTGFPPGAEAMLITYDSGVRTKGTLGPIQELDANALGVQRDYKNHIGSDLVVGVKHAITEIARVPATRRVILVLGDGNDTDNDAAKSQLQSLAKDAAKLGIEVHAIAYKTPLSDPSTIVTQLDPKTATAATPDELTADVAAFLESLRPH